MTYPEPNPEPNTQGVKFRIFPDREKSPNEDVSGDDIYMTR